VALFWLGLFAFCSIPLLVILGLVALYYLLLWKYMHVIERIFQEKPLFNIPRGQPLPGAHEVRFPTADGLTLCGCYLSTPRPRRGVILFGLEFGSKCWSCWQYCEHLVQAGYDVFAFEPRNQGTSDVQQGYEPLQWVTDYEVRDTAAAVAYLKSRPDADPRGIGVFGISKGAGAAVFVAARDPYLRCIVTDGMFAVYTTLVPYMRYWFRVYDNQYFLQGLLPSWYYGQIGLAGVRKIQRQRHCHFPHLENALGRLRSRPLLMIHGEADTYIKSEMAQTLFRYARPPCELWLVPGAKHNQALQIAGQEYRQRVLSFFEQHLAALPGPEPSARQGASSARDGAVGMRQLARGPLAR
jgi:alpha-beta hydrolase superfamily lysophospholipase